MSAIPSLSPSHRPVVGSSLPSSVTSDTQNPVFDPSASSFERSAGPSPTQRPTDGLTPPSGNVGPLSPVTVNPTKALVEKIAEASSGLELDYFASEASDGFSPVHINAKTENLSSFEDFKKAVTQAGAHEFGLTSDMLQTVGKFEDASENFYGWIQEYYADSPEELAHAKELVSAFSTELRDAKVIIVGQEYTIEGAEHPVFIVGIAKDGSLVGVQSTVVWT